MRAPGLFEGRSKRASKLLTSFSKRPRSTGPSSEIVSGRSSISCSADFQQPNSHLLSAPEVIRVLGDRYQTLRGSFGETVVQQELRARLTPEDFYGVLRRGQGGVFPSLALLKYEESPVRAQVERVERVLRRYGETPVKTVPRTFARDVRNNLRRSGQESAQQPFVGPSAAAPSVARGSATGTTWATAPARSSPSVIHRSSCRGLAFEEYLGIARAFGKTVRQSSCCLRPLSDMDDRQQGTGRLGHRGRQ